MPTATILINELLEKQLSPPVDWITLIPGCYPAPESYIFTQTVKHQNITITNVTLKVRVKMRYYNYVTGEQDAYREIKFKLNEIEVLSIKQWWDKNYHEFEKNVTSAYRTLEGTVPQILEIIVSKSFVFSQDVWWITAYLEVTYTSGTIERLTGSWAAQIDVSDILGTVVNLTLIIFIMQLMLITVGSMIYE